MKLQLSKPKTVEEQQEEALLIKYAAANLAKHPLTKKQKKKFDSADYFLSLYKG